MSVLSRAAGDNHLASIVSFIELCGHDKYAKTALFGASLLLQYALCALTVPVWLFQQIITLLQCRSRCAARPFLRIASTSLLLQASRVSVRTSSVSL